MKCVGKYSTKWIALMLHADVHFSRVKVQRNPPIPSPPKLHWYHQLARAVDLVPVNLTCYKKVPYLMFYESGIIFTGFTDGFLWGPFARKQTTHYLAVLLLSSATNDLLIRTKLLRWLVCCNRLLQGCAQRWKTASQAKAPRCDAKGVSKIHIPTRHQKVGEFQPFGSPVSSSNYIYIHKMQGVFLF